MSEEEYMSATAPISSILTGVVEPKVVSEFKDCVLEIGRFNKQTDVQTCKQFVEDSLTENEIRELIRLLEN